MMSNYELTLDEWYENWFAEQPTPVWLGSSLSLKDVFAAGYSAGYAECNSQHAWNRLDVLVPQKREDADA